MANLIEGIQAECNRVRKLIKHYNDLGPIGAFGAAWMTITVTEAEYSITSGDAERMLAALGRLRRCE